MIPLEKSLMKLPIACLILPLALAACGDDSSGNVTANAAAPVAAVPAPAGQNWEETVAATPEGGHVMGNPNAPIKLIEYGSRSCPTCGAFGREGMRPLIDGYVKTGKVSYEFRDFFVHGAPDLALGLLGNCSGPQTFFPLLEQMYQNQQSYLDKLQNMSPAVQAQLQSQTPSQQLTSLAEQMGMIDFVKQRGISESQARACLTDKAKTDALAKFSDTATQDGGVTGTPTFLINGTKADAVGWAQLEPLLKAAGG
jgi:protein-disulfide isomerase